MDDVSQFRISFFRIFGKIVRGSARLLLDLSDDVCGGFLSFLLKEKCHEMNSLFEGHKPYQYFCMSVNGFFHNYSSRCLLWEKFKIEFLLAYIESLLPQNTQLYLLLQLFLYLLECSDRMNAKLSWANYTRNLQPPSYFLRWHWSLKKLHMSSIGLEIRPQSAFTAFMAPLP